MKCYLKTLFTYITDVDLFFERVELMQQLYTSITCNCDAFIFNLNCDEDNLHLNNVVTTSLVNLVNAGSFPAQREEFFRSIKEFIEIFQNFEKNLA